MTTTVLAIGLLACTVAVAQGDRAFTIDDLLALRNVNELALSPSGRWLAYSSRGELYVLEVDTRVSPIAIGKGTRAEWSPDGTVLAFLRVVDGQSRLFVWHRAMGTVAKLADIGVGVRAIAGPHWSPDGRELLVDLVSGAAPANATTESEAPRQFDASTPVESVFSRLLPEDPSGIRLPPESGAVELVDTRTGKLRRIIETSPPCTSLSWAPDSSKVACSARIKRPAEKYSPPRSRIRIIDASRGFVTNSFDVDAAPWSDAQVRWSPDGKALAYLGTRQPYEHERVFVSSLDGAVRKDVTALVDRQVDSFIWERDARHIVIAIADGAARPILSVNVKSGAASSLVDEGANVSRFDLDGLGNPAWVQSTGDSLGTICVLDRKTGRTRTVLDLNPQLREWRLGRQQVVHWRGKDGESLEGVLITPYGYHAGTRYPLVVDPYTRRTKEFQGIPLLANQLLAQEGYAVFYPNPRSFHGWAYTEKNTAFGRPAEGPMAAATLVDDVLSGVDALIDEGIADPNRLALYSFSDGATTTNFLITRTDRFKAAVSGGGVTDFFSYYFMVPANDWTSPDSLAGRLPEDSLPVYTEFSPLFHVQSIHTPLLLLTGDEDRRALQEVMFFNALRRLGRQVTLVRYPGEGHQLRSPENVRDYWHRAKNFLDQHLKP